MRGEWFGVEVGERILCARIPLLHSSASNPSSLMGFEGCAKKL